VALERPPEGGELVDRRVAGDLLGQLGRAERALRVQQGHEQGEEALELVHGRILRGRHRAQSEAMSFSTRSSWARNGSLHSTVRWAWSLSFRCTQSTV